MTNPVLYNVSRQERRAALKSAVAARKSGNWGAWETLTFPPGTVPGDTWAKTITVAHRCACFSVLQRNAPGAIHLAVSTLDGARPTWHEMLRIKNDIAGPDATAIEVYPPMASMVDAADMFHIWVVPALPFGIGGEEGR